MNDKKVSKFLITVFVLLSAVVFSACGAAEVDGGGTKPKKIRLDYAYYSPVSLVLKEKGWVEEAFAKEEIEVEFVLSQGSNKALEFLNSDSVDFGSTAGAAALIAKSKGAPIQAVYIYSKPEWTALVARKDSTISEVKNLKGKKVAATAGTDPFIFLLRALDESGLSPNDIELVNLQHADGATALLKGEVDAWAGLDPHMARLEVEEGAKLFYRNPDFNTYGFLNVRNEFVEKYPQYVVKVIKLYEKARKWTLEHPEEAVQILAKEAQLDADVAKEEMNRNDFSEPIPGDVHRRALQAAAAVLQKDKTIDPQANVEQLIEELVQPSFAQNVIE